MADTASGSTTAGWRFWLGIASFIAAFAVHLVTLAALALGASPATIATISAVNFALNKVLLLVAVAFLGRDGFNRLRTTVFGAVRAHLFPDEVGPVRYTIGLLFLVIPLILAWITPYTSEIWPLFGRNTVRDGIIADIAIIVGLLLLGGGFWEKLRALFVREATVVFPGETGSKAARA